MWQSETQSHFRHGDKMRVFFGTCCLELVSAQARLETPGMSLSILPGTQLVLQGGTAPTRLWPFVPKLWGCTAAALRHLTQKYEHINE